MSTIISLLKKIRLWGVRGISDYIRRRFRFWKTMRFLRANARQYPSIPERGITILADLTLPSSLSKVIRDLSFALKKVGIPFQTFDLNPQSKIPRSDCGNILTPINQFRTLKYDHIIEMFASPLPAGLPLKRSRILFWEFATGLLEYNPSVARNATIIAMSDFNRDVFRQMLPNSIKVKKILYPFFFDNENIPEKSETRKKYGIPAGAFVVFFNFDYGSSFNRKNPDGSIRAFAKAFADNQDTVIVFKTKGAVQHQEERNKLVQLANDLGVGKRMIMIDSYIPQHDIYGLTNACDVYLSLHRGEGFGLGIVEAMSLGKPVVATDYSSTTEFCFRENSIPVAYSLVKVPDNMRDHPCYHSVKEWAEPDINAAAEALIKLYNDPKLRTQIGSAAKSFVEEHFSAQNFRKSVDAFLQDS